MDKGNSSRAAQAAKNAALKPSQPRKKPKSHDGPCSQNPCTTLWTNWAQRTQSPDFLKVFVLDPNQAGGGYLRFSDKKNPAVLALAGFKSILLEGWRRRVELYQPPHRPSAFNL
jgi:hypothetical protein